MAEANERRLMVRHVALSGTFLMVFLCSCGTARQMHIPILLAIGLITAAVVFITAALLDAGMRSIPVILLVAVVSGCSPKEQESVPRPVAEGHIPTTSNEISHASYGSEDRMNRIREGFVAQLRRSRTEAVAVLRQKIQAGSPVEKDAALYVVEDETILELIPCAIAAITDKTAAPRYQDTGWGYVGRHAGWVVANLIRKLDPTWLQEEGYEKSLMDVCNDKDRDKLKSSWTEWWNHYQKKQELERGRELGVFPGN